MLALTELSELSTLEDEFDSRRELVLIVARFASKLDDEFERLRLDARLVDMFALAEFRDASTLDDELDKPLKLVFSMASVASTLEELLERLRLDV